jgi:hypothetical protein
MKKLLFLIVYCLISCKSSNIVDPIPPVEQVDNGENTDVYLEEEKSVCPNEMTQVHGMYCPKVQQICLDWMDDEKLPYARCRKYKDPSVCLVPKVEMNYCINTEEMHDNFGLPYGDKSWTECKASCEHQGNRLCNIEEIDFSCEGEQMLPYPYGYEFSTTICNVERTPIMCGKKMCDYRATVNAFPKCMSPFGIHNLVGNVDEWVWMPLYHSRINKGVSHNSALSGGHAFGGRHRCRPKTVEHSEHFINPPTTGCRCCKSI